MQGLKLLCMTAILGLAYIAPAWAQCDPNENCNRCLVSAFGKCLTRGNDPVCEARKLSCQRFGNAPLSPSGPLGPFGPTGPLRKGGPANIPSVEDVAACLNGIRTCTETILARLVYPEVQFIVEAYKSHLYSQAKFEKLPSDVIARLQPYYAADLREVRYAEDIDTIHGQNITFSNDIFFVQNVYFSLHKEHAVLLAHELEHVTQYHLRGGEERFLPEYIMKAVGNVISTRSFNVHDAIDMERAANAKAAQVNRDLFESPVLSVCVDNYRKPTDPPGAATYYLWCYAVGLGPNPQEGSACTCRIGQRVIPGEVQKQSDHTVFCSQDAPWNLRFMCSLADRSNRD
ncbi:DUF4157 domain-containing protein [Sinorhizobium medicae]|nr:DUF4157 domain-containing protein [Sinorhizobium medicae]